MTTEISKVWVRLMAVLQLMTALSFMQASLSTYQNMAKDQTGTLGIWLAVGIVISVLNLIAGWTLLDETKFGLWLSLVNIAAQTVSIGTPIFSYIYVGVVHFDIWITLKGEPKPDFLFGFNYELLRNYFNVAFSQVPNLPTIAVSPIALAVVIFLSRRLRLA